MAQIKTPLTFTVRRRTPVLIVPATPTPRELKPLSDIDDHEGHRFQMPVINFYRHNPKMGNKNPASVIREALAKALVFYYPFAGRIKEGPARKLAVDCSGEGVLFIEAAADVTLEQFGGLLYPPFPCMEELLYDVPGSGGIVDSPLLLIQVTRLLCGGFIFAIRLNHTMSDAGGFVQFLMALSETAQGASIPSTLPVWQREMFLARDPPRVTCAHPEFDEIIDTKGHKIIPPRDDINNMAHRSFFFGPAEVATIRRLVPPHLKNCSTFEVLTACLWRCRTIALQLDPKEHVRIFCIVSARAKFKSLFPVGYYGNAFARGVSTSTVGELCNNPLEYALDLVIKAKSRITEEYMRSLGDLLVIMGRPDFSVARSFAVTDMTRAGFDAVDFGWGKAVYGGPGVAGEDYASFYFPFVNKKGEKGIVVPMYLPIAIMDNFVKELNKMLLACSRL